MSWAGRRRATYLFGVILFFFVVVGLPLLYQWYLSIPPACATGTLRPPGQTSGPCSLLDPQYLQPSGVLWAHSFKVRDGTYTAVAYVENPNQNAGVKAVTYKFGLYDPSNILVAERTGSTYLMPGAVTPVLEGRIDTGNRIVAHTYFQLTEDTTWQPMQNSALPLSVSDKVLTDTDTAPRLTASVTNTSVADLIAPVFIAVMYDAQGNAFAASETSLDRLNAGETMQIAFTWPEPFPTQASRIEVTPLLPPTPAAVP